MAQRENVYKSHPIGLTNAFWRDVSDQNTILGFIPIPSPPILSYPEG
jgi:hypothetical protein